MTSNDATAANSASTPAGSDPAPLRILHLASSDLIGGANIAAHRLHKGLNRIGVHSQMYVRDRVQANNPTIIAHRPGPSSLLSRFRARLRRREQEAALERCRVYYENGFDMLSDDRTASTPAWSSILPANDLVNMHFVSGFVDQPGFYADYPADKPLVVTLHDMVTFTGGCHYDNHCGRFTRQCGNCPQMGLGVEDDLSRDIYLRKQQQFARRNKRRTAFVADSYWLRDEARRSSLLQGFPITTIHYGLDHHTYRPLDRAFARDVLNLPQDAFLVLAAAASLKLRRKGFRVLLNGLEHLRDLPDLRLITMGVADNLPPAAVPVHDLGYVDGDRFIALAYSAVDAIVVPSLMEAFGQTSLEAMACGVPVVAFRVGGLPDMITHGEEGLLVDVGDAAGLAAQIRWLHDHPAERQAMGRRGRARVEAHFTLERQGRDYLDLYRRLLDPAGLNPGDLA